MTLQLDEGGTQEYFLRKFDRSNQGTSYNQRVVVSAGDRVAAGTAIATVGKTGLASAPHVHYEVRVRGEAVDPLRVAVVAK